jgi:hypothetical protein
LVTTALLLPVPMSTPTSTSLISLHLSKVGRTLS